MPTDSKPDNLTEDNMCVQYLGKKIFDLFSFCERDPGKIKISLLEGWGP